jgi:hypothetical protein
VLRDDDNPKTASSDAAIDLPAEAVTDPKLELIEPNAHATVDELACESTDHRLLVLARMRDEDVKGLCAVDARFRCLLGEVLGDRG